MKYIVGPWIGEFGWELFCWQGWVRRKVRGAKSVVVASRPDMQYLYHDFCTKFIPIDAPGGASQTRCGDFKLPPIRSDYPDHKWLNPIANRAKITAGKIPVVPDQQFIQYGKKQKKPKYDIIYHARSLTKYRTAARNWPMDRWMRLTDRLSDFRIGCIGTETGALHIPGTEDLRGLNLENTCTVLRNAKLIIGPSSGPMHLASLCGTPQLVWSEPRNRRRYGKLWNPFKTPVYFLETWNPLPAHVLAECLIYNGPERTPANQRRYRKLRHTQAYRKYGGNPSQMVKRPTGIRARR
jgi:hypothetical protein